MGVWVRICSANDVPIGQVRGFHIEILSFPVLVAQVEAGRFLAASSVCPHEDISLVGGELRGAVITCPGHGYEFDLMSGQCAHDAGLRLRLFPVRLSDDVLYVNIDLHRQVS